MEMDPKLLVLSTVSCSEPDALSSVSIILVNNQEKAALSLNDGLRGC